MTQCKSGGEAKDTSPSLLVLHTDIHLIQKLPGMPPAGIELFTLLALCALCISGDWVPLQQQHMALSLENPQPNENVKRFNALVLSQKG